jgi:DNA-binding response OmpR family regulator
MDTKKILIVDDEHDAIEFVKAVLDDANFEFIDADNGKSGIHEAIKELPDLIILDVMMPEMDGFSVFNELRKQDKTKNIPIIMLTGVADKAGIKFFKEDMKDYFDAVPVDYLEKPLDPEKLQKVVTRIFRNSEINEF